MSTSRNSAQRQDRQERARQLREAERRAEGRKRRWIVSGVVAAVVVVAIGIGIGVGASQSSGKVTPPKDGVTTGARPRSERHADREGDCAGHRRCVRGLHLPDLRRIRIAAGSTVVSLINDGKIKVRYHMMSFIDDHNGGTTRTVPRTRLLRPIVSPARTKRWRCIRSCTPTSLRETSKAGLCDAQILDYAASVGITEPAVRQGRQR